MQPHRITSARLTDVRSCSPWRICCVLIAAALAAGAATSVLSTSEGKLATKLRTDAMAADSTRILAENSLWKPIDGSRALIPKLHRSVTTWQVTGALPTSTAVATATEKDIRAASTESQLFRVEQKVSFSKDSTSAQIQQARLHSATCGCAVSDSGVSVEPAGGVSSAPVRAVGPIAHEFTNPVKSGSLALGLAITGLLTGLLVGFVRRDATPLVSGVAFLTIPLLYKAFSSGMWLALAPVVLRSLGAG